MEPAWELVKAAVATARRSGQDSFDEERGKELLHRCTEAQKAVENAKPKPDVRDERIDALAEYTDHVPLGHYSGFCELVPQLVNMVSLCEALPDRSSRGGGKLPLDLQWIASKCVNSYYAPHRFAAVQLAFSTPRCRVLIFRECPVANTPR